MRYRSVPRFSGGATLALSILLVACASQAAVTATPAGVAATQPSGGCPTSTIFSATYPPAPTLNPSQRTTPGAGATLIAQYHATYPLDPYQNIRTTDLAPQVASQDKASLTIQHADCTVEKILLPPSQAIAYIRALPANDKVVGGTDPLSALQETHVPGIIPTPKPGQTPGVQYDKNGTPVIPITPPGGVPSPSSPTLQTVVAHWGETAAAGQRTATALSHGGTSGTPTATP